MRARAAAPRGTRDVLPPDSAARQRVVDVGRARFASYGYRQIVTPTFEETEVFARSVGASTDIVRKEMYTFLDGSGRSMTLRPEGTAPVVRAYLEHGLHKRPAPLKLWYLAPMFRYEAPQAGRYREHYQLGVEALGSDDPLLDVEVIALLDDLYRALGVPGIRLRVGDMGDAASREPYRAELRAYLWARAADLPHEARERIDENPIRLFDHKDAAVAAVMAEAPLLLDRLGPEAAARRAEVLRGLDALGIDHEVDASLVRGLDYYTHTVFEFTCDRLGAQSGIGGGGRYDGLVEQLGGPPTPGIGFGTGLERITLALAAAGGPPGEDGLDCYVAVLVPELRVPLLPVLARLRAVGLACESAFGGRSLKSALRHASALGARRTVIVGAREYEQGVATVRDMDSGEQRTVALGELAEALR